MLSSASCCPEHSLCSVGVPQTPVSEQMNFRAPCLCDAFDLQPWELSYAVLEAVSYEEGT